MSCDIVNNNHSNLYFEKEESLNDENPNEYVCIDSTGHCDPITINKEKPNKDESIDLSDHCDASTIINVSLMKKENKASERKCKRKNSENVLDDDASTFSEFSVPRPKLSPPTVDCGNKVIGWLETSYCESLAKGDSGEDAEKCVSESWMYENSPDTSPADSLSKIVRVRVFLLEVEPNPDKEPLELVSGYCFDGCRGFFAYSTIVFSRIEGHDVPLCCECAKAGDKKELKLIFKLTLKVMDTSGTHADLYVWKEQAEEFFGCSTKDFLLNDAVRYAAVNSLIANTVANTFYESRTPLLDLNLVCIKNHYFITNSRLVQTNKSRKIQDTACRLDPSNLSKPED